MDITLKQSDIEKAVKMYVERQGIHLHSKTLEIAFAMGRGTNGLSANLTITDVSLPAYDAAADAPKVSGSANVDGALTGSSEGTTALKFAEHPAGKAIKSSDTAITGQVVVPDTAAAETEVATTAPATKEEVAEAAIATPATEAAAADTGAVAEAKPATEAEPVATAEASPAKATTSLFG